MPLRPRDGQRRRVRFQAGRLPARIAPEPVEQRAVETAYVQESDGGVARFDEAAQDAQEFVAADVVESRLAKPPVRTGEPGEQVADAEPAERAAPITRVRRRAAGR